MAASKAEQPAVEGSVEEDNDDAEEEQEDGQQQPPPKPRRIRGCITGVQSWMTEMMDLLLPPPPPPPSKITRKEKIAKKQAAATEKIRKLLYKQGIDLKEVGLAHLSDKRLREFAVKLDEHKKRIFIKAPKIAILSAAKLLHEFSRPVPANIKIPWGLKKGTQISAQLQFSPEDPPYDPDDPGPKPGFLRLSVIQEGGFFGPEVKDVFVDGVSTTDGTDNVVVVKTMNKVGQIFIICSDEPARWKWFCGINAGLHRVSGAKVMLDQPAAIVPWHDNADIEKEEEN